MKFEDNKANVDVPSGALRNTSEEAFDTIIVSTYAQVIAERKRYACADAPASFATTVTTFSAWIESLWELFGDGRMIVSRTQRNLAMAATFALEESSLPVGTAALAARCIQRASGLVEFEQLLEKFSHDANAQSSFSSCSDCDQKKEAAVSSAVDTLSPSECELVTLMVRYRASIARAGLIEMGEVLSLLPLLLLPSTNRVLYQADPAPTLQQIRFLEACQQAGAIASFRVVRSCDRVSFDPDTSPLGVQFAFPSGRYAEPRLLVDLVKEARRDGPVVITAKDPSALYDSIAAACVSEGLRCSLRARKLFVDTDFGRAYRALFACVHDESTTPADLADWALSPFSGMSSYAAQEFEAAVRADRTLTKERCLSRLRAENDAFSMMEELVNTPEAGILMGAFEDRMRSMSGISEAYRREQLGAMATLRDVADAALSLRVVCSDLEDDQIMHFIADELQRATIDISRETRESIEKRDPDLVSTIEGSCEAKIEDLPYGDVFIASQQDVAALAPECAAVIVTDMTAESYPASIRAGADATLLQKVGLPCCGDGAVWPAVDGLARARSTFQALLAIPEKKIIIERCLYDAAADKTYPAAVVQEFINCFRKDPSSTEDLDDVFELPESLRRDVYLRGEELLYENAAVRSGAQPIETYVNAMPTGFVSPDKRSKIVLPRVLKGGRILQELCLSPSQIESYAECPYKWFAQRRCRIEEIDEGFGPLQMGDFAHYAFKVFYEQLQSEKGLRRVTLDTLDQARALMWDVLKDVEESQFERKATSNRLIPLTELELREVEDLKAKLVAYLDYDAQLLPGFVPTHFEYAVNPEDGVMYAGAVLTGSADRIDVDAQGNAVIIDYKSSVGPAYELHGTESPVPRKVQTLIYAQAVRRTLGYNVVGALYTSYGRSHRLAGAYDPNVLPASALPLMRHDMCVPIASQQETFDSVLDATEDYVAGMLESLLAGKVAPCPLDKAACTWCPVASCPKRMVPHGSA